MKMTKEEIRKRIKECEAENEVHKTLIAKNDKEIAMLREELNKPECGGKRWKPERGQRYWLVGTYGNAIDAKWTNGDADKQAFAIGNVFPTKEAAEFELERRKVIAELSDFAEGDDAMWDGAQKHYKLCCDRDNCIAYDFNRTIKYGCLHFPTKEAAESAVEAVGEERVKKYYLGVKE